MFRTSDTILVGIMMAVAAFTYKTKHDAEKRLHEVRKLRAQIEQEEDFIGLLLADWSFLSRPDRLQALVDIYQSELELHPSEPYQNLDLEDIPRKEPKIEALLRDPWATERQDKR